MRCTIIFIFSFFTIISKGQNLECKNKKINTSKIGLDSAFKHYLNEFIKIKSDFTLPVVKINEYSEIDTAISITISELLVSNYSEKYSDLNFIYISNEKFISNVDYINKIFELPNYYCTKLDTGLYENYKKYLNLTNKYILHHPKFVILSFYSNVLYIEEYCSTPAFRSIYNGSDKKLYPTPFSKIFKKKLSQNNYERLFKKEKIKLTYKQYLQYLYK